MVSAIVISSSVHPLMVRRSFSIFTYKFDEKLKLRNTILKVGAEVDLFSFVFTVTFLFSEWYMLSFNGIVQPVIEINGYEITFLLSRYLLRLKTTGLKNVS